MGFFTGLLTGFALGQIFRMHRGNTAQYAALKSTDIKVIKGLADDRFDLELAELGKLRLKQLTK
jgi:hypothetical protein